MITKKQQCVAILIKTCEGIRLKAYKDTANIWTIGIGQARTYPDGTLIKAGDTCTEAQAYDWLNSYLEKNVYPVVDKFNLPDPVYEALCSFAYNASTSWLKGPSFTGPISKQDWGTFDPKTMSATGLAASMLKFDKITVDGQKVFSKGLQNRRIIEIKHMLGLST